MRRLSTLLCAALLGLSTELRAGEIREEFAALCRSQETSDEMYRGRARERQLGLRLEQAFEDPVQEVIVRYHYGRELLENGRPRDAIGVLEDAMNRATELGVELRYRDMALRALALAHLQAAEDRNCVLQHTAASCILPIRGEGVHREPEHARAAARMFLDLAQRQGGNWTVAWLANLSAMVGGEYPDLIPQALRVPSERARSGVALAEWTDRAMVLGVDSRDLAGGAIMDDFDGDGLLDLVSSTSDPCGSLKAFRNDGPGGFEDVTRLWGLEEQLGGLNVVHADYDNDGWLDLLVLRGAWLLGHGQIRNSLLRNGLGSAARRFEDVTFVSGIAIPAAPTQTAAWADYDGDGDLDLYVGNETSEQAPHDSQLFRNEGHGRFSDQSLAAGVTNGRYAKAVTWGDFDDDGDPDLYVSNVGANRLYRNEGDGTFVDVAVELGVTQPEGRSFASWFFDFDNDGDLDLFVASYDAPVNTVMAGLFGRATTSGQPLLYRNEGGVFHEVSRAVGLTTPTLPMGANFGDVDGDGWLDVYLGTGDPEFETLIPNLLLRNESGRHFVDMTAELRLGHLQKGHGVAFGDIDNDGDQDLFHQLGGFYPGDDYPNALFENPGAGHHWITLELHGRKANRFGLGARIELRVRRAGASRVIHQQVSTGGSFGGSSMRQEIGLGSAEGIEKIIVRWPGSGTYQEFSEVEIDRAYRMIEGEAELEPLSLMRFELKSSHRSHIPGSS